MSIIDVNFWKNKRVFLTGHTGFKGGWLAIWLHTLGANVAGYSLVPNTKPNFFEASKVSNLLHHIIGDIRDLHKLERAIQNFKPEIIIHLAAQPLVQESYDHPVDTYSTNVIGTVNLLEASKNYGKAQAIIVVSSDKCYENREQIWSYRENDKLGGHDPYSASKACTEIVTKSYMLSYFNKQSNIGTVASVRAGNVIGGGDWSKDRIVPDIVRALVKNQAPAIRNPVAIRPWQHVLEPLSGYLKAVEFIYKNKNLADLHWNFGPYHNSEISVNVLANIACKMWGNNIIQHIQQNNHARHEANFLTLDWTKARKELYWCPKWNIDKALQKTMDWYKGYYSSDDMYKLTLTQIDEYQIDEK